MSPKSPTVSYFLLPRSRGYVIVSILVFICISGKWMARLAWKLLCAFVLTRGSNLLIWVTTSHFLQQYSLTLGETFNFLMRVSPEPLHIRAQNLIFTFMLPEIILGKMHFVSIWFSAFAFLCFHSHYITTEASLWAVSFPSGLELLAQPCTALSDVTDVVGKYRFADAELMWQVSIIEFHGLQCCGLWESIHTELWYLTLLECPKGLCTDI